ncbi:methyltransferase domain-containing protein [Heliobacterium gestii]|uniref:Methyltransferase domain-containing protein n=2 Tax=Heliomicrobium gestii TaxID=2699 RepID=A0A845L9W4_HELGE|nr:methyltransferase domain-containing protein [Heliomicrobium gestii]
MSFLDITSSEQWRKYFAEGSIDAVMAEHVWEHMTKEEGQVAAQNCYNFLKPGGYLRVAVPDGYHPNKEYIQAVDVGKDEHQCLYTYDEFCKIFLRSGFAVKLLEYWDENGEFHYRDWDCQDGMIHRSRRFDRRNVDGRLGYTSIIVDAIKIE